MSDVDLLMIGQSEVVNYEEYSRLPLDRLDLYRELVFPRMVYYKGKFRAHLDLINLCRDGMSFQDGTPAQRRDLLSVWNLPSCAAMHLANYLLGHDFNTCIINNFDADWDRFCEVYNNCRKPPLVGISSTFHLNWSEVRRLTKQLRAFDPDMEIVVGGAFMNALTFSGDATVFEKPMRHYGVDEILYGFHAERDLLALLQARRAETTYADVTNLAYVERGQPAGAFSAGTPQWNQPVLGEIPFLWDQLDLPFVRSTVHFRASCGCPFSCAFCSYPKVARGFQMMDIEGIRRSLESVFRIPGVNRVCFIDDTFNVPKKRFQDICRLLCEFDCEWYSFLRVQFIDDETARLMADSGCRAVYLGLESANNTVLRNMNKRATCEEFAAGVALLKKYGITSMAAFVLGFPGETADTIRDDVAFIENSGIDFYTLKEFYYMEHTPVYEVRDTYQLTGMGNQWAHATMDSATAYRYKTEMCHEVRNATFLDADTSLWYVIALCDAGYSIDQIRDFQREINAVTQAQMRDEFDDNHPAIGRLRSLLAAAK